jgi:hypothetical protein
MKVSVMAKLSLSAVLLVAALAMPAGAEDALMWQLHPYALTAADAASINARRPADWSPSHVSAGDVFTIDEQGLIHIMSMAAAVGGGLMIIEDLEPQATDQ